VSDHPSAVDSELQIVANAIRALDPDGKRTAKVLRETIDQLYDGQRTGRYRWDQLYKTEKTHCGTLVEINLQREFKFNDGEVLDFSISDSEVDCKYSQEVGKWMIPPEATNQLCLVLSAKDNADPNWCMGLVRATENQLSSGGNRDAKRNLNVQGKDAIHWLFHNHPLPPNVLLQLEPQIVHQMMAMKSGAGRIRQLFRVAQQRIVGRNVIATVGQQKDFMKRVRANGGARTALRAEGLLVLGQYSSHVKIANDLGILLPGPGDSISVRVVPTSNRSGRVASIAGEFWKIASDSDPVVIAPELPIPTKKEIEEEDGD
jgi:hypothetical protein